MAQGGPPTRPRPVKSPLGRFKDPCRGVPEERIDPVSDVGDDAIQRLRHLVGRVASDIFAERRAVDITAGAPLPPRQPLGTLEHVIRHGHSRLHTRSITRRASPPSTPAWLAEAGGYVAIVLGARRKGWVERLLTGSVMRDVLERVSASETATLVVVP